MWETALGVLGSDAREVFSFEFLYIERQIACYNAFEVSSIQRELFEKKKHLLGALLKVLAVEPAKKTMDEPCQRKRNIGMKSVKPFRSI